MKSGSNSANAKIRLLYLRLGRRSRIAAVVYDMETRLCHLDAVRLIANKRASWL